MINGYGLYDIIGNVAEWTLTTSGYGVESYPQQESLVAARNMPAYGVSASSICRGSSVFGGSVAIYFRREHERTKYYYNYSASSGYYNGFRVLRRDGDDRPTAVCEIKEDFETWEIKTSSSYTTQSTSAGEWRFYVYVRDNAAYAYSGCKYLYGSEYLYLPDITNQLVEIRCRIRNSSSDSRSISLGSGNSIDGYTGRSVTIPAYSDYHTISLSPTRDASSYRLDFYGLYLDDIEIWTIPRATGE